MRIVLELDNGLRKWADLVPSVDEGLKSSDPQVVEQAKADVRKALNLLLVAIA